MKTFKTIWAYLWLPLFVAIYVFVFIAVGMIFGGEGILIFLVSILVMMIMFILSIQGYIMVAEDK